MLTGKTCNETCLTLHGRNKQLLNSQDCVLIYFSRFYLCFLSHAFRCSLLQIATNYPRFDTSFDVLCLSIARSTSFSSCSEIVKHALDNILKHLWGFFCRDHLESYTSDYTVQVLVGYCMVYIFMQTFMIPGTVFMSLLAGALFGVFKGVALVVFTATAGASSCYFLSKLIGRPLVFSLWPDKLNFFQAQVAKRRERLLNYMLFLRVTPTLPNTFINVASPIVDVPYHIFFLATLIGIIPAAYVTVRAGLALGELQSVGDLYDFQVNCHSVPYWGCLSHPHTDKQKQIIAFHWQKLAWRMWGPKAPGNHFGTTSLTVQISIK
ncbi:hypothetical protein L1049_021993 [Liquidambar formosana]|uniref:VTT domain-containing protein n=1 Tax=Liquidambar formosana TaxID=63359 RepID=A0AAP0RCZ7_LIQFO